MTQDNTATILSTAANVNKTLGTQSDQQGVGVDYNELASNVLWILSSIPGPQSMVLNMLSGAAALASQFAATPTGQPTLTDVTAPAAQYASTLDAQYQASLEGLDDAFSMLVSDRGALEIAAENVDNSPGRTYSWAWITQGGRSYAAASNALTLAAERQAYETLFPLRYELFRVQPGTVALPYNDVEDFRCMAWYLRDTDYEDPFNPFYGAPRFSGWNLPVSSPSSSSATATTEMWAYAGPDAGFLQPVGTDETKPTQTAQWPSPNTLLGMFQTPDSRLSPAQPIFTPLQFALEAYDNGVGATTVRNVNATSPNYHNPTNLFCQLGTAGS